jgi:hypothetical protein
MDAYGKWSVCRVENGEEEPCLRELSPADKAKISMTFLSGAGDIKLGRVSESLYLVLYESSFHLLQKRNDIFLGGRTLEVKSDLRIPVVFGPELCPGYSFFSHKAVEEVSLIGVQDPTSVPAYFWRYKESVVPAPLPNVYDTGRCCYGLSSRLLIELQSLPPRERKVALEDKWKEMSWNTDLLSPHKIRVLCALNWRRTEDGKWVCALSPDFDDAFMAYRDWCYNNLSSKYNHVRLEALCKLL